MMRGLSRCDRKGQALNAGARSKERCVVPRWRLQHGFTLVELVITLAITAILLSVAAPAYQSFIGSTALTTATNDLVAALNMARSEALKRDGAVTLRAGDADTASDDFADGYCIVPSSNATSCSGALRFFPAVGSEITIAVSGVLSTVTFNGLGGLTNSSNAPQSFELCRAKEDHRRVTIALVGRSKVSADSSCP